jgi:hypothetical protein
MIHELQALIHRTSIGLVSDVVYTVRWKQTEEGLKLIPVILLYGFARIIRAVF